MRTMRRVGVLATAGLFLSAFIGGPADADTPAAYTGSAKSTALTVSVLGQSATAGISSASGDSSPNAAAAGTGAVLGTTIVGEAKAAAGQTVPEKCGSVGPLGGTPTTVGPLTLGVACGTASASVAGGFPVATSEGNIAGLDVSAQSVLSGPLAPVTGPVTGGLDSLLNEACTRLPQSCNVTNTIDEVLESLVTTKTLEATIGKATSSVTTNASKLTALGEANAAEIKLLPAPVIDGVPLNEPFATIQVAKAGAKVECDIATGTATNSVDPAIVRIKLAAPIFASLPAQTIAHPAVGSITVNSTSAEIVVAPGTTFVVPGTAGTPIETEIVVAAGKKTDNPDGTKSAVADGVKIHALKGLQGGVLIDLAHAEATAGCKPAVIDPVPVTPPAQELPRTGGTPVIPMLGAGALLAAVVTRRTLLARSN